VAAGAQGGGRVEGTGVLVCGVQYRGIVRCTWDVGWMGRVYSILPTLFSILHTLHIPVSILDSK
jgi:hypothetical protein